MKDMEETLEIKKKEVLRRLALSKQRKAEAAKEALNDLKEYCFKRDGVYPKNVETVW